MSKHISNEELAQLVEKSVLTSSGGQLNNQQTNDFVNLMADQTTIMQHLRVENDVVPGLDIDGMEFESPIITSRAEGDNPPSTDEGDIDIPRLTLNPKEIVAFVDISEKFLRKNIKKESAEEDINRAIAKAIGKDLVRLGFNGDTSLAGSTRLNRSLNIIDGIITQAAADSDINDFTIAANPVYSGSGSEFTKGLRAIPKEYREDRSMLRHFVNIDTIDDYEEELEDRKTSLGDTILTGDTMVTRNKRVEVVPVFGFPENTILTSVWANLVFAFGRYMRFEKEYKPRRGVWEITVTLDFDCGYIWSKALALGQQA